MKQAPEIRFVGMEASDAVASAARDKAAKLELFCPEIMACRVVIEQPHRHQQQGRSFSVRIDLTLPRHELAVNRAEHEDVYVALRDAFDDMRRKIEQAMQRMQAFTKEPTAPAAEPEAGP
jgi:ribosomal subunit interface protein